MPDGPPDDTKAARFHRLIAEQFREAGLLLGVFGLLEAAANRRSRLFWSVVLIFTFALIASGYLLESKRKLPGAQ